MAICYPPAATRQIASADDAFRRRDNWNWLHEVHFES